MEYALLNKEETHFPCNLFGRQSCKMSKQHDKLIILRTLKRQAKIFLHI